LSRQHPTFRHQSHGDTAYRAEDAPQPGGQSSREDVDPLVSCSHYTHKEEGDRAGNTRHFVTSLTGTLPIELRTLLSRVGKAHVRLLIPSVMWPLHRVEEGD
jgi:hypothetical protein